MWFEIVSTVLWLMLWVEVLRRVWRSPVEGLLLTLAAIILGIIASDGVSGFFHWFFDTFFDENTPIIGAQVIAPFREHHRDPLALTRHGFFELNGNSFAGFVPIMTAVWWAGPGTPETTAARFLYEFLLTFSLALAITNQLHRWAHDPNPPRIVRLLQHLRLAISPEHHAGHHQPPHNVSFCVTTGWLNRFTDTMQLPAVLERIFTSIGIPRRSH